jgi:MYXO-CTERM domain-containing protein
MNLRLLHRRLAVLMGMCGLLAFAAGAGFEPVATILTAVALASALFWHPDAELSQRMERVWLPIAALLVVRALYHAFFVRDDVVMPVVDLLLLLMSAESLRSLDAPNDFRLYALSFALVLASTAYRPGVVFLVAFVAYVVLGTVTLMVGHLRRAAERHRVREVPLGRGIVGTTSALSLVTLFVSAIVFVTFPRVSRGWAGRDAAATTSIAGFSDVVSIGDYGTRIYSDPQIVLRVEFPDGTPPAGRLASFHWRGRSYDHFDGIRWSRSRGLPPSAAPARWYRNRWKGPVLTQRIYARPLSVHVLFGLHPVMGIDPGDGIQALFDNAGDFVYWGSGPPFYTVYSRENAPTPDELRSDSSQERFAPSALYYLQLPDLDPRIPALADSLTRGLATRYDKVMAIEQWLQGFRYTLQLPATPAQATLANFLFVRRAGHCEYFSTAMVVLLRTLGIEARNVNGFLGGEWSRFGDYLAVTENQAHSWVEVWFPGYGWVTFDPTPGGGNAGEQAQAWFWPGRFLLDAIQHRWSKWVLDYNVESQAGIFQRWAGALRIGDGGVRVPSGGGGGPSPWVAALALLAAGAALLWLRRRHRSLPPATRMYMMLRQHCARAGLGVSPGLTPLALVERVRKRGTSAGRAAERVVDLYLRARYGHEALGESELREMREALGAARRTLRAGT